MKVYVVTSGDGEDNEYKVEAVFTDKEKAQLFFKTHEKDLFTPYQMEVFNADDEEHPVSLDFCGYWISIDCKTKTMHIVVREITNIKKSTYEKFLDEEYLCYVCLEENNEKVAKQIAADMCAKALAEKKNL